MRPVVEVQLSREQRGENVVRVVRITTRHTFQINRGARYCTPGRKITINGVPAARQVARADQWRRRRQWRECGLRGRRTAGKCCERAGRYDRRVCALADGEIRKYRHERLLLRTRTNAVFVIARQLHGRCTYTLYQQGRE